MSWGVGSECLRSEFGECEAARAAGLSKGMGGNPLPLPDSDTEAEAEAEADAELAMGTDGPVEVGDIIICGAAGVTEVEGGRKNCAVDAALAPLAGRIPGPKPYSA
jgi:hypothetical protein